jgi:hypothetical protein
MPSLAWLSLVKASRAGVRRRSCRDWPHRCGHKDLHARARSGKEEEKEGRWKRGEEGGRRGKRGEEGGRGGGRGDDVGNEEGEGRKRDIVLLCMMLCTN